MRPGNFIVKGGTPTLKFRVPDTIDLDDIVKIRVTISSASGVLVKDNDSISINKEEHLVLLYLTQKETLSLGTGTGEVQIKLKNTGGDVVPTVPKFFDIIKSIDNEEL